jgi:hypothetical protein
VSASEKRDKKTLDEVVLADDQPFDFEEDVLDDGR